MALINFRNPKTSTTYADYKKREKELLPQRIAVLEKEIETGFCCEWNYDKGIRIRKKLPLTAEDIQDCRELLEELKEELRA